MANRFLRIKRKNSCPYIDKYITIKNTKARSSDKLHAFAYYLCPCLNYFTSSNIKYIDNQLVTVIKIQMICKCKYKTI